MKGQAAIEARDRIMEAAKSKGVKNMSDLARRVGIHEHALRNMGQGHMMSKEKLEKIGSYLDITMEDMLGGPYEPTKRKPRVVQYQINQEPDKLLKQPSDPIRKVLAIIPNLSDRQLESALDYLKYLVDKPERD